MATKEWVDHPDPNVEPIDADWLNEVDAVVHDILGAPTTDEEARANLGPYSDALVTATGSTTATALADRFANIHINAKSDSGATGDGTTDDSDALRTWISDVASSGRAGYMPEGTYIVSKQSGETHCLQIKNSNVTLILHPKAVIKLKDNEVSGTDQFQIIKIGDGTSAITDINILGYGKIDGNSANNSSTAAISSRYAFDVRGPVERVRAEINVVDVPGGAMQSKGKDTNNRAQWIWFFPKLIDNCAEGVQWEFTDHFRLIGEGRITNMTEQDNIEPASGCKDWIVRGYYVSTAGSGNSLLDVFPNTANIEDGLVTGCTFEGGSISLPSGTPSNDIKNVKIVGNTLLNVGVGTGSGGNAIDCNISHNYADGETTRGRFIDEQTNSQNLKIIGNTVLNYELDGLIVRGTKTKVISNTVKNNGQDTAQSSGNRTGINVQGTDQIIALNHVFDDQGTQTQRIGILYAGTRPFLFGNVVGSHPSNDFNRSSPTDAVLRDNVETAAPVKLHYGIDAIDPDANGEATIAHGLSTTPTVAFVNLETDPGSTSDKNVHVKGRDATNITVRVFDSGGDVTSGSINVTWWVSAELSD